MTTYWKKIDEGNSDYVTCDNCGYLAKTTTAITYQYCPRCGRKVLNPFGETKHRMAKIIQHAMMIQEHLDLFEQIEDDESDTPDNLDRQLQKITESQVVVAVSKSLGDELGRDAGEIMEELGQVAFERYKNAKEYCDSHRIDDNLKKWNEGYREAITREEYEYSRSD